MSTEVKMAAAIHHLNVRRTARYATIGEPGPDVSDVWIVCHGHAQLARKFIERFRCIEAPDRLIVAPEALNRYYLDGGFHGAASRVGATWMTTEDREMEIADYVAYLDDLYTEIFRRVQRPGCTLRILGFSQGVATAARWVVMGAAAPDQVVLWSGSLPAELTPETAAKLSPAGRPLSVVVGDRDEYFTAKVIAAQRTTLEGLGVPYEVTTFAGGHEIDPAMLIGIAGNR